jgi:hypothetical protein
MLSIFIAIIFLGCSKDETTIITGTILAYFRRNETIAPPDSNGKYTLVIEGSGTENKNT